MINESFSDFQIYENKVIEFNFKQKPNNKTFFNEEVKVICNLNYGNKKIIENEEKYLGVIELKTFITGEDKNKEERFKLVLTMQGTFYQSKNTTTKENFDTMLTMNGISVLVQLSRAYITSTTALSGINPPLILPMINIFKLKNQTDKEKK